MKATQILKNVSLCGLTMAALFSCSKTAINEPAMAPKAHTELLSDTAGLIAWWPLDSLSYANDRSGHFHHGVAYNTGFTTDRFGTKNGAFYFNGSSSYISVDDQADLRLTNTDFTINAWVKLDSYNSSYGSEIVTKRDNGPGGYCYSIRGYAANPYGVIGFGPGGNDPNAFGSKTVTTGAWHMTTTVYNLAQQKITLYVDGVLDNVTTGILPANAPATAKLYIGRDEVTSPTNGYFLQGALNDIRIYNRALSAAEIQNLYNPNTLNNGLIAYWPLDGARGATDISGNNHNGVATSISYTTDSRGKTNGASYFNGSSSFIAVNDSADLRLTNTDFTLNAWVKLDDYNASYGSEILTKRDNGPGGFCYAVRGYAASPYAVAGFGPGGNDPNAFGTKIIGLNGWHMVTCIYSYAFQQVSFYVDGVLDNVTSGILPANAPATVKMYLGRDEITSPTNGYFLKGAMEEVRIYGRQITANEVQQLYNYGN
ncbi:LamG domain-containing protein [Chitinophaga vietnamensis]|uniref:LamG domain-containing protein n=1 Tax=Chitinophaga vietnamensis TaxID=2593957 RepID=UPI0011787A44|nr:LamG domain-containing protein [Chitinophaga vietnamensis]